MTGDNPNSTFIRRKFTITETLDDELTGMAARNYQGNVSLCLRAAIEDHKQTLEGTDTGHLAAQRLATKLEALKQQQDEIQSVVESRQNQTKGSVQASVGNRRGEAAELTEDMRCIYTTVKDAEHGLRIEDIAERVDIPPSSLKPALESFVDLGLLIDVGDQTQRLQLAETNSTTFRG